MTDEDNTNRAAWCGALYRHRKGGLYYVNERIPHTETGEILVIYDEVLPGGNAGARWARPESLFMDGRFVFEGWPD